jgi:hypothetical protein
MREAIKQGQTPFFSFPGHPSVGMWKPGAGVSWCGQRVVTTFVRV